MRFDQVEIESKFLVVRTGRAAAAALAGPKPDEGARSDLPRECHGPRHPRRPRRPSLVPLAQP